MNQVLLLPGEIAEHAVHLAKMGKQSEVDGVVCSVHEAVGIKAICGQDFITVTPGIRLEQPGREDRKGAATPDKVRDYQADRMALGRGITELENQRKD